MLKHVIRLRNDALRIFLMLVLFIPYMVHFVVSAARPAAWGGHPNKRRLLEADFYTIQVDIFLMGMHGTFVGTPIERSDD